MVILGLGSNLGDRLANLRTALTFLKKIPQFSVLQVSPVYISDALLPENAPQTWDTPYLNLALRCETSLTPYELLQHVKRVEIEVGRKPEKSWGPRIIDIDLLAWDDLIQYDEKLHIPHEYLHERPFALWPLADVAPRWIYPLPGLLQGKTAAEMVLPWGSRFSGNASLGTRQIQQRIDTPQLVGILNVTPDSFSDGGAFIDPAAALQQIHQLVANGAEIIDIGAEATGPNVKPLTAELEWRRLEPVLDAIMPMLNQMPIKPKISIDTRHALVAKKALASFNVDWINDVSGLIDPAMRAVIADHACDVVIMHHLGIPVDKNCFLPYAQDPVSLVYRWAEEQLTFLEKNHINPQRIILDVGIGYGKTPEQSFELIQRLETFQALKTRLFIGHSRKSFLQQFTPKAPLERDLETAIFSLHLASKNVDYLRIHNVEAQAQSFKIAQALSLSV